MRRPRVAPTTLTFSFSSDLSPVLLTPSSSCCFRRSAASWEQLERYFQVHRLIDSEEISTGKMLPT